MPRKIIKHIWFDFSDTIASIRTESHNRLRYEAYSQIVGRPVDQELMNDFDRLYELHNHSNSAVFHDLGKPTGFWSDVMGSIPPQQLYGLAEDTIPQVLQEVKEYVPISIFSNIRVARILPSLGIDLGLFAHIVGPESFKRPKPALDGFYKMVDLSELPPDEILYIGDGVGKDIRPAKELGMKTGLMWKQSDEADYSFGKFEDILELFLFSDKFYRW